MTDEEKYKAIGQLFCIEIVGNRKFRRQIEGTKLGIKVLGILNSESVPNSKPKSRFKRFMNRMRNVFNSEYKLHG